ncbi:MAG: DinB superfamily protein [Verrucomicrobiales bacterium]|nr:DinB superfamily protein [Verrucomicrobiales bacterium]
MKTINRLFCVIIFAMLTTPGLRGQSLAPEDLAQGIKYLEKTRQGVIASTKGLSEAQWKFKAATNRWSVAEVTEHIAAAEDLLMAMVQDKVMKAPGRTEAEDLKALDQLVLQKIPDRSAKAKAPEPLEPKNQFGSPQASLKHFQESRAKTIAFLKATPDVRQHVADSPMGKKLDAYQWVLFVAAHSERHTKQIEEVKADPNFPKR